MSDEKAPWARSFRVEGSDEGRIPLEQIGEQAFALGAVITYVGAETGLEGRIAKASIETVRTATPAQLANTDLASVPRPIRWFVQSYGVHTPAALVHDALIGEDTGRPADVSDALADRYFRFMLRDLGVPFLRRWMMWSATAMGTRWRASLVARIGLLVWTFASLVGVVTFTVAMARCEWTQAFLSLLPILPASLLWGRQAGAGFVGAFTAAWVLPPTVFGVVGYGIYLGIEKVIGWFSKRSNERP